MLMIVDLRTTKKVILDGAAVAGSFGTAKTIDVPPGDYEVRVVGGNVAVVDGDGSVSSRDLEVVENAPVGVRTHTSRLSFACTTGVASTVALTRRVG